ncbi:MAG: uracil phosphoribosyltransferase [Clostridiales bacterium]|jgi:uracil phosphoribosyltransferase|nr:uracil phosphoribosyltransferase [Clostridiales bacterium]
MKDAIIVSNPLISHYVGIIRDANTCKNDFVNAVESIVYLMSFSITGHVETAQKRVMTPVAEADVGYFFDKILLIPILRAGLAMFDPMRKILPLATFGYVGIKRKGDKVTDAENMGFTADMYYCNLPPKLHEFKVMILDVVIATGSTVDYAIEYLIGQGVKPENISLVSIISSRPGLDNLRRKFPEVSIYTCEIDEILTEKGYISPGLGDAGNRYNGYDD